MPVRKRLAVAAAALLGAALVAAGVARAVAGAPAQGLALAGVTVALGLAVLHVLWPPLDLTGRSLRRGPRRGRAVALTFDDGPSADTPAVLAALERAGARATFFVLGSAAERHPTLVREIARRGHEVALHGFGHVRLALAGPRTVAREVDRGVASVRAAGVEPAPYFRAPHGWKGPFVEPVLRARGLRLVAWTRGVWDTERPGAAAIAARATRRPRDGEILLLHDGCGTPGIDPRRDQTAEAIPEIVARWRAAGYRIATVGELAAASPPAGARATALWRVAGLVVLAAAAAVAVARLDLRGVLAALTGARPGLLAAAVAANVCSLCAHAGRWRAVIIAPGAGDARVRWRDSFVALLAGFAAGLALPARAGDLLRAHLLARRSGVPTATVVAASALDYVVGTIALVPALLSVAALSPLPLWGMRGIALVAALGFAAAVAAWLLRPHPGAEGRASEGFVGRLRSGLAAVRRPRALVAAFGWAMLGWLAEGTIAYLTLDALGLPATPAVAALAVLAASAATAVALAPGNAGTFEFATAVAVAALGVPGDAALAFALAFHAVHAIPVALAGGAILLREGLARDAIAR